MAIDFDEDDCPPRYFTYDRRRTRVEIPECPTCHTALHVDVRSADTLYARCKWCGHRTMISKPGIGL